MGRNMPFCWQSQPPFLETSSTISGRCNYTIYILGTIKNKKKPVGLKIYLRNIWKRVKIILKL
ncbi:hypothetical protein BpHYR1_016201 [Brachionus plicatilis]|uniref:Uncharacterized protein n=1 Tax=Brachionus plicatilis TaxID=10195 RepID=A0A3M7R2J6_BRAPC|nr:hypothetical protein BpHYR1_016201 [Brachionus plicatilis]